MPKKTHGLSREASGGKSYVYGAWAAMKQRCLNPKNPGYRNYGGRGIVVCDRWLTFENFYEDMGDRPSPLHSLDRKDNGKGYYRSNCRWATKQEQSLNQRDRMRVCRKTDALLLSLAPELHSMGFSMRNIAALFSVGKTTIEKVLRGDYSVATVADGKVYVEEQRATNHPPRIRRIRRG